MRHVLLAQLPIPQVVFGKKAGNIPLAAACLAQAAAAIQTAHVTVLPQSLATYLGDAALYHAMAAYQSELVSLTLYSWNIERSLHLAQRLQNAMNFTIVLGGPEATHDNPLLAHQTAFLTVYGDGEAPLRHLLRRPSCKAIAGLANQSAALFRNAPDHSKKRPCLRQGHYPN